MVNNTQHFGDAIKTLRHATGQRTEAIAVAVGCSHAAIYAWEAAPTPPVALTRFARLAEALNISLDELANLGAQIPEEEGIAA